MKRFLIWLLLPIAATLIILGDIGCWADRMYWRLARWVDRVTTKKAKPGEAE